MEDFVVVERGFSGVGQGWGEFVARALRRLRPKPASEHVALEKALDRAHLHSRLGELQRHSDVTDAYFGVFGLV